MSAEPIPIQQTEPLQMLASLEEGLGDELSSLKGVSCVEPSSMPESYQRLLVHDDHMTPTLKAYHGETVELRVLSHWDDGRWYHRKIHLTTGARSRTVEFGLVRLDLDVLPDPVRQAVIERDQPLGDILIYHGVMTHVDPRWFVRFDAPHPVSAHFEASAGGTCYGRLGTIRCNGSPAMELLEVVTDKRAK